METDRVSALQEKVPSFKGKNGSKGEQHREKKKNKKPVRKKVDINAENGGRIENINFVTKLVKIRPK